MKFTQRIAKLFEVKSLITLAVTSAFTYMAISGQIETQQFMTIFTVIISFYFGTQASKLPSTTTTVKTPKETPVQSVEDDDPNDPMSGF